MAGDPEGQRTARRVAGVLVATGVAGFALVVLAGSWLPVPGGRAGHIAVWATAVFGVAVLAELVTVPLRHGDSLEELTFFEVALAIGALTLPPPLAVGLPIVALAAVHVVLRRPLIKTVFNLGLYTTASSLYVITYLLITHGEGIFSAWSVAGLFLGALVFTVVNITALVEVLHAVEGLDRAQVWREEWRLSAVMAVATTAVGITAIALQSVNPVLTPLATLPALALWYVYAEVARNARERDRDRCLVEFGLALATPDHPGVDEAVDAVRRSVGADRAHLVLPPQPCPALARVTGRRETVTLDAADLPDGWTGGVGVALDLGRDSCGALLLGSTDGWRLRPEDATSVATMATALAGALRASRARQDVEAEAETLRAVIEHSTDGIAVVAGDGVVQLWSPALARMTGLDATGLAVEQIPEPVRAVVTLPPGDAPAAYRPPPRTVTLPGGDGEPRSLVVSSARVADSDPGPDGTPQVRVTVHTVHDVTATMRADRLKADFVATISHELRTPITPIKGYAQLLARRGDRMDPARRAEALELIAERADHLSRLVDDLLLVSRVAGPTKLTVNPSEEDLRELVRRTTAAFPKLGDRLVVELPDGPVMVRCDGQRAQQCLSNLLSNAEKYTPPGSPVEVRLAAPAPGAPQAVVTVRDHGPGIAADEQDKVFERFYRIEDPFTMRTGGSGLGLHIARELAIAMGGGLTLFSEQGDGCTFSLALPVAPATRPGPAPTGRGGTVVTAP